MYNNLHALPLHHSCLEGNHSRTKGHRKNNPGIFIHCGFGSLIVHSSLFDVNVFLSPVLPTPSHFLLRGEKPSAFQLQNTSTVEFLPGQGCSGHAMSKYSWQPVLPGSQNSGSPFPVDWLHTCALVFSARVQAKHLLRLCLFRLDIILGSSIAVTSGGTNGVQECWVDLVTAAEIIQPQQKSPGSQIRSH